MQATARSRSQTPVAVASLETESAPARLLSFAERQPWLLFACTLAWLPLAIRHAWNVRLWIDEIVTLDVSRMGNARMIDALRHGVDLQPPFFYWVTRAFEALFGYGEIGVRSQAVFFFFLFTVFLFRLVQRSMGAWYGCAAVWLALNTVVFGAPNQGYSSEARPYAMLLAFSTSALLCWTSYRERPAWWKLPILTVAIAATVSCHYFGVFAVLPLLAGECAVFIRTRKPDFRVLTAIALGFAPQLFFLPIARAGMAAHRAPLWQRGNAFSLEAIYVGLVSHFTVPLFLAMVVLFFCWRRLDRTASGRDFTLSPENLAGAGYFFIPIAAIVVTAFSANAIMPRYVLPALIGIVFISIVLLYRATGGSRAAAAIVACCCALWFVYTWEPQFYRHLPRKPGPLSIAAPEAGLPIVIASADVYFTWRHYSSRALVERLRIVADPQVELQYPGMADVAVTSLNQTPYLNLRTIDFRQMRQLGDFYAFEVRKSLGADWLVAEIIRHGGQVQVVSDQIGPVLFRVHFPPAA